MSHALRGHCAACASPLRAVIDRAVRMGKSNYWIEDFLLANGSFLSREVIRKHRNRRHHVVDTGESASERYPCRAA